jgi:Fe2+ or Zn2+ uptake regulation protein
MSPHDRFREYLERRDRRLTEARVVLLDAVWSQADPFQPEMLVEELRPRGVSRAAVIRNLAYLQDAGLLQRLSDGRLSPSR